MFFYATFITPAMIMRLTDIGSQYIGAFVGSSNGEYFDGGKTYKVTISPAKVPAEKFWSLTVYDNQTRSMLDTPQRYPRAGSQSYPTPAAIAECRWLDDSVFRPEQAGRGQTTVTGFRPRPARAGTRSCASTAPLSRSSPRPGGRARSNW